jgi:hypothetical protein
VKWSGRSEDAEEEEEMGEGGEKEKKRRQNNKRSGREYPPVATGRYSGK